LAEAGNTVGAIQIAGTTNAYQIPFFVVACDYVILGEEMFAASAHFAQDELHLGSLRAEDIIKGVSIGLMIVGALLFTFGNEGLVNIMIK
ncbi:MAG: DUF6754 domain-containing protein, partial [Bacillota bacterium]